MSSFKSIAQRRKDGERTPFRYFLAGPPHSGKTSSLACLPNAGYKMYYLDFDGENTAGVEDFLTPEGSENFITCALYGDYNDKNKADKKMTAYDKCRNALRELKDEGALEDPNTFLVVDSLTNLGHSIMAKEERQTGSGEPDKRRTVMEAWHEAYDFLGRLMHMTSNCNIIILCHTEIVDIEGRMPETGLTMISKNYSLQIKKFPSVSNIGFVERNISKTGESSVVVHTRPTIKFPFIKTSYVNPDDVPAEVPAEDFLLKIYNRHVNGKWGE